MYISHLSITFQIAHTCNDSLGRLTVSADGNSFVVKTRNVVAFSINPTVASVSFGNLQVDASSINIPTQANSTELVFVLEDAKWKVGRKIGPVEAFT